MTDTIVSRPSWASVPQQCERCGELLKPERIVWLELRTSDNAWLLPGEMEWTDPDSQGVFPFGARCANQTIKNGQDW